jgi:predicted transcriptional regulator
VNLTIDMPDDLVRRLEGLASAHNQTVQQFALEHLSNAASAEAGSPAAVLEAMFAPPRLADSDVAELEAAIASGRLSTPDRDIFSE